MAELLILLQEREWTRQAMVEALWRRRSVSLSLDDLEAHLA
jgi:hypothetical protein